MPNDLGQLAWYLERPDEFLANVRNDRIAATARILALRVAHFKARAGDPTFDEPMRSIYTISGTQARVPSDGFEVALNGPASLIAPVPTAGRTGESAAIRLHPSNP